MLAEGLGKIVQTQIRRSLISIFTLCLSPASGAGCFGPFYVQDVKKKSWSDKPLAAPIATSEIVLLYALSNLTKPSDKSFVFVCIPILVTTFLEWRSGKEPMPHTPGAVRPSSLCL